MKKILIVIPSLSYGGTNRALLNLLNLLDGEKYDIDLFALTHQGILGDRLRSRGLLPESSLLDACFYFPETMAARKGLSRLPLLAAKCRVKFCLKNDKTRVYRAAAAKLSRKGYDLVIAFQEGLTTEFASYIEAGRRIAWFHCDYSKHMEEKGGIDEGPVYSRYDTIAAVSDYTAEVFKSYLPQVADRVVAIHNCMDQQAIRAQADQPLRDPAFVPAPFTLISVGRMDPLKRFPEIPGMAARLKQRGIPLRWYLLGTEEGPELDRIRSAIREHRVEEEVILLGVRSNPYPYIRSSSLLVCPSLSEACPNVVNEALILGTPVVAADFPSAAELIEEGKNGFICPIEQIPETLVRLWEDRELFRSLRENLQDFHYDNEGILARIETILDGEKP